MRNLHVPLPDDVYARLRSEADRSGRPATVLAREAIRTWLRRRRKIARHEAITAYAARWAGSSLDLDPELEAAGLEHWLDAEKGGR